MNKTDRTYLLASIFMSWFMYVFGTFLSERPNPYDAGFYLFIGAIATTVYLYKLAKANKQKE